jgi:small conductance mechanosensitive channel
MEFLENLLAKLGEFCATTGIKIIGAILVLLIGFALVKWVLGLIKKGKKFAKLAPNTQTLIIDIVMVALYVLVIAIAACTLGVSETAIASVITSCGLIVGLALQGSLSNFAGGVMILLFSPFSIGDFIEANGVSGTVKNIGIFYTSMTTPDNKVVTMPNGTLSNAVVIDYSVNDTRRLDLEIGVSYDSDIELVKKTLLDLANAHELVLKDPAPFVRLGTQGDSALVFKFRVWVKASDYWTVNFDLLEASKKIFDIRGINIPYPQMDVHVNTIDKK